MILFSSPILLLLTPPIHVCLPHSCYIYKSNNKHINTACWVHSGLLACMFLGLTTWYDVVRSLTLEKTSSPSLNSPTYCTGNISYFRTLCWDVSWGLVQADTLSRFCGRSFLIIIRRHNLLADILDLWLLSSSWTSSSLFPGSWVQELYYRYPLGLGTQH